MKRVREEEIFPRNPNKTYGLMELVKGSSTRVDRGPDDMVSSWPHLLIREAALFSACFLAMLLMACFLPPPLEPQANAQHPPNPAKAPWYFLGLQELVAYDAFWGGLGIPGIVIIVLMAIPYVDRHHSGIGRWFARSRRTACTLWTIYFIVVVVLIIIGVYFRGPNWGWFWPGTMPKESL